MAFFYLVRDVADIAGGFVVDGGIHRAAVGMAQHHHQPTAQMAGSVLDAAQLVVVDDVARQPDDEQLTDARREDVLRDDPGIRTGDDDGVGRLALRQVDIRIRREISPLPFSAFRYFRLPAASL